jgi:hypothetical protein
LSVRTRDFHFGQLNPECDSYYRMASKNFSYPDSG